MAKNVNKIIAGALVVVGGYFLYKYFTKKPLVPSKPQEEPTVPPVGGGGGGSRNDKYPLKKGSKGKLVSSVQQWLLKIDKNSLPKFGADGDFGSETEAAVLKYLGKKTVDSDSDIDKLILIYNQKTFPLMVPKPQPKQTFPTFGFPK